MIPSSKPGDCLERFTAGDGETPADAAGVGLAEKNKWKALLTEAVKEGTNAPESLNM
jgi:hypothetical protein